MLESGKKILVCIMAIALGLATGCSDKAKNDKTSKSETTIEEKQNTSSKTMEQEEVKGKYSDNEVYKGDDGKDYSKTEDGTEVEITGENFQTLIEEYEKVKGTGSDREKELLDQIQVIMDIVSNQSVE